MLCCAVLSGDVTVQQGGGEDASPVLPDQGDDHDSMLADPEGLLAASEDLRAKMRCQDAPLVTFVS